jgi:3-deoxy-D-manno-octulosonate 8-phosphate phosphatase KdsC-like HAD superfamily phosphatase
MSDTNLNTLMKAFKIFDGYARVTLSAEHDEIFVAVIGREVMPADAKRLKQLGWEYDKSFEAWKSFV